MIGVKTGAALSALIEPCAAADYLWPYDRASAQGDAIRNADVRGKAHVETCDPGLFPSYLFDYSKEAARKAWLDIVARGLNASVDGVYAGA